MKKLFLITLLIFLGQAAFALNIVYPKQTEVTINSASTFFVGSADTKKDLTINGNKVPVHSSGGFAQTVPLVTGKNTFTIKSGNDTLTYIITRPQASGGTWTPPQLKEYEDMKYATVSSDNSPIRTTPVDGGINRIANLQKGIPLVIDGEKGNFYRVILGAVKEGWISKSNVKMEESGSSLAELKGYDYLDTDEFYIFVFHLNRQTPWELVESNPFLIKLYNVQDQPDNTYVMDFPVQEALGGKKLLGYSANFSGTDFIVKIRKPILPDSQKPLKNIKITIDPGHGGSEAGAVGCLGDLEKNINLEFAKYLEDELKNRGASVSMTRTGDSDISLNDRVEFTNDENSMIFISLHGNALPDNQDPMKHSGTEIYYYYNQAKPLADWIMNAMVNELGVNNRGIRQQSFAVVRNTNALSLLIETGYLINPSDNAKLIDKEFQKKTAKAIADGIENYLIKY